LTYDVGQGEIDPAEVERLLPEEKLRRKQDEAKPWFGIHEYWIQVYFREHALQLGFKVVSGPDWCGPDFEVIHNGKQTSLEVEHRWDDYLRHKHHLDVNFGGTGVLVVLSDHQPLPPLRRLVPGEIVHLDPEGFLSWHRSAGKRFAEEVHKMLNPPPRPHYLR
jgi:hypothetical protein